MMNEIYKVKEGYVVAIFDPDNVRVQTGFWDRDIIDLFDKNKKGLLSKIISYLDGKHMVSDIIQYLGHEQKQEILDCILFLVSHDIVEKLNDGASKDCTMREMHIKSIQEMASHHYNIGVIGADFLACHVLQNLVFLAPVGGISIMDSGKVSNQNSMPAFLNRKNNIGRFKAEVIADYLMYLNDYLNVNMKISVQLNYDIIPNWLKSLDFLIISENSPNLFMYNTVNDAALKSGLKWAICTFDGHKAMVGPTFIPGQTPCYKCYELRLESAMDRLGEFLELKNAINSSNSFSLTSYIYYYPPLANIAANLVLADLPEIMNNGTGLTVGKMLRIDMTSFSIKRQHILRIPNCPCCKQTVGAPYELYNVFENILDGQ